MVCVCASHVNGYVCVRRDGGTVRKERQIRTAGNRGRQHSKHAKHLKDTAAVAVRGNVEAVAGNRVVDELVVFCVKLLQAALHHVVACRHKATRPVSACDCMCTSVCSGRRRKD